MKRDHKVKSKTAFASILLLIIVIILVNNIANRRTFSNLNDHIASIYKDRLMPATYIFQLTDHLYQKKLLQSDINSLNTQTDRNLAHDKAIADIIKIYEKTYLTAAEKKQWIAFRQELTVFNKFIVDTTVNKKLSDASFNKVLKTLNILSEIQSKEGNDIFKKSSLSINGTIIMFHLEAALLLILGITALIMVSTNDNKLIRMQRAQLN